MLPSLAWGWSAAVLALALGCGRLENARPLEEAAPASAGGGGSVTATGGKATTSAPPGNGGAVEPRGQGGQDSAGGETTGAGGATLEQPCAGVAPRCRPGEAVCDPVRGKLTTCSECGEALPGGDTECVRLLSSDKMPRVCVLDDERQLRCGDIFADAEPAPLGSDDTVDFAASNSAVCALSVDGRVSCWDAAGAPLDVPEGW